jgi:hypothetical protein
VKVLIDEDVADPFVARLVHVLPPHEIFDVRAIWWRGKKDVPLYADAAKRGFRVMVSANHHQLLIPDEVKAIRKSRMHVVYYEQPDEISGLGRTAGGLLAAIVPVIAELDSARSQLLVRIPCISARKRHGLTDPLKNPPEYWT